MARIVLLETVDAAAEALLVGADVHLAARPDAELGDGILADTEAIVTRGRGRVTAALLERTPRLRVVARCGVGLDNVDVDAASERGIAVINAPGSTTTTLAEHTLMLILAAVRQLIPSASAVRERRWQFRNDYDGDECAEKLLGIVGTGAIGRRVAGMASACGMTVETWNRTPLDLPYPSRDLDELLARADVVSLHVALTPETHGLIDSRRLALMKRGAVLVNSARGALVERPALLAALDGGHLAGYAADGLDVEPPPADDPLTSHPRTLITPHSAALTKATYRRLCERTVRNVVAFLDGGELESGCIFNQARLS